MNFIRLSKRFSWLISLCLMVLAITWAFSAQRHSAQDYQRENQKKFSLNNALTHLKVISEKPHYVGTQAHSNVRKYLVNELRKLGLEVEVFQHLSTAPKSGVATKTQNIITKINGSTKGKALALVSHYDSSTHSSLGASDAGSGVVTILEGIRAFLANGKQPKNDIIIVLTDAEEQGLLGAGAFVNFHPWAKNIGLVLNFEARGSGGSSYMFIETNGGNKKLIQSFSEAGVNIPVANSLIYEIYKLLPNDTDLTMFRELADIDGFNFAFMDDHFDYHTVQDSYQRIDKESLNHQADYLMASLNYFAFEDLTQLKSDENMVYFNFPGLNMVIYPYSWVSPLAFIATLLFFLLTFNGLKQRTLSVKGIVLSFVPLITSLLAAGSIGYFGWQLLLLLFPQYADIAQGYTYNGHWILAGFISMTGAVTLLIYQLFNKRYSSRDLFFAPISLWLIINIAIALKLPGGGFFVIPLYLALACFAVNNVGHLIKSKRIMFTTLLVLPSLVVLTPIIPTFVIGLGLKSLFIGTLLTCLTLLLLVPIFCNYPKGNRLTSGMGLLSLVFLIISAVQSDYTEDRKKPNSVNYIFDLDTNSAFMISYNRTLDEFTRQFFDKKAMTEQWDRSIYPDNDRVKIRHYKATKPLSLQAAKIEVLKDELINNTRTLSLLISPQRATNIIQLASMNTLNISIVSVNGQAYSQGPDVFNKDIYSGFFFKYVLSSPDEKLQIKIIVPKESELSLKVYETSFDLFEQINGIQARSALYMPEPFSINDAIIIGQLVNFNN